MSQNRGIETVEQFLARGGVIQEIEQGVSGDMSLKFNNVPLEERIRAQKRKTYTANHKVGSARNRTRGRMK